ncbi:Uncharacterised protein g334 [Pycnogonum litorale]
MKEAAQNSPVMRRRLRSLISNRQYSLDTGMDLVETIASAKPMERPKTAEVGVSTDDINDLDFLIKKKIVQETFETRNRSKSVTLTMGDRFDTTIDGICNSGSEYSCNDHHKTDETIVEESSSQGSSSTASPNDGDSVPIDVCMCVKCGRYKFEECKE